jgi:hypothetical protein
VTLSVRHRAGGQGRVRPALGRLLGGLVILAAGCARGGPMARPQFSPEDATAAAMAEYDANKDGALDAKEVEKCPALREGMKQGLDKNKDGRVTPDELTQRLQMFLEDEIGSVFVQAYLDGAPLEGATVTLTPEKFMGPSFKPATGTTQSTGTTMLQIDGQAAVPYGYYRIEVSKKDVGGKEMIPARYNTQTTLGHEVASSRALNRRGGGVEDNQVLPLSSK